MSRMRPRSGRKAEPKGDYEIGFAHGYLLHEFHSPVANRREDSWGGDAQRRMAFPLSVAEAVRAAVPDHVAVGARITGTDWTEDGLSPDDAVALARALKDVGMAYVCVTSGGIGGRVRIPVGRNYQVPFAAKVRAETGLVTRAVGLIVDPVQANAIVADGEADQVALARAVLDDPRWGWHAAAALGADLRLPPQYERVAPKFWPGSSIRAGDDERSAPRRAAS